MADREEWLKSLQEFGRGPDIAGDYAALMKDPLSLREYEMRGPRGRKTFVQSNDNNSNYSADMLTFPDPSPKDSNADPHVLSSDKAAEIYQFHKSYRNSEKPRALPECCLCRKSISQEVCLCAECLNKVWPEDPADDPIEI
jgi:hypothetical protein